MTSDRATPKNVGSNEKGENAPSSHRHSSLLHRRLPIRFKYSTPSHAPPPIFSPSTMGEQGAQNTTATPWTGLDELAAALSSSERLIKILVGERTQPYLVQDTLLRHASEYFVKAIKHETLGGADNVGVLRFPEDDEEAWKVILFWIVRGRMPTTFLDSEPIPGCHMVLAWTWILADRYLMPELQDEAMVILLCHTDSLYIDFDAAMVILHNTAPDSKLQRLALEELIVRMSPTIADAAYRLSDAEKAEIDELGVTSALVATSFRLGTRKHWARIKDSEIWKEFLVGQDARHRRLLERQIEDKEAEIV